jgi:hypothetical protein
MQQLLHQVGTSHNFYITRGLFLGVNRQGRVAHHLSPYSVELKNEWRYNSAAGITSSYHAHGQFYVLPLHIRAIIGTHCKMNIMSSVCLHTASEWLRRARKRIFGYAGAKSGKSCYPPV